MIDMFSGLGGASEAFIRDGEWNVFRFDNNQLLEDVKNTIITDHMFERMGEIFNNFEDLDLIWASPPCLDFSTAFNAPKSKKARGEKGFENWKQDFTLIKNTIDMIRRLKPKFWVIENVRGSIKDLDFPFIQVHPSFKKNKSDGDTWSSDPLRANKRAKIPYEISMGLKIAIEEQRTLLEWV